MSKSVLSVAVSLLSLTAGSAAIAGGPCYRQVATPPVYASRSA